MNRAKKAGLILLAIGVLTLGACSGSDSQPTESTSSAAFELPSAITGSSSSQADESRQDTTTSQTASNPSSTPAASQPTENYSNYTAYTDNSANAPDINNIHVRTTEAYYPTSAGEITVVIENRTGWQIVYADDFTLERMDGTTWRELELEPTEGDKAPSFLLDNNRDTTMTLALSRLKGELTVGRYRISLPMLCNGYAGRFTRSAEFTVK